LDKSELLVRIFVRFVNKFGKTYDEKVMKMLKRFYLLLIVIALGWLVIGCGGGGGTGSNGSSGLGSGLVPDYNLKFSFMDILGLSSGDLSASVSRVARSEITKPIDSVDYSVENLIGVNPKVSPELQASLVQNQSAHLSVSKAVSSANKVTYFRVVITGPGDVLLYKNLFPSNQSEARIYVEAGQLRHIVVEALTGYCAESQLQSVKKAEGTFDLQPSQTTDLNEKIEEQKQAGQGNWVVEEVDNVKPITAIFHSGAGLVEGPHKTAVEIFISNFENSVLYYKISEKDVTASLLKAVTSGYQSAVSTAAINLSEEGVYLFEYYSIDDSGNQESLNEKIVTVNFNKNPPVTKIQYDGLPSKILAGSKVWLSIEMTANVTGNIYYELEGESGQLTSSDLKNKEAFGIKIGSTGFVPNTGKYHLKYWSELKEGSIELTKNETDIYVTEIFTDQVATKFVGSASSVFSTGTVPFCDTDSTSIYKSAFCNNYLGKLQLLETGPFSPGNASEYSCLFASSGKLNIQASSGCDNECTVIPPGGDETTLQKACNQCIALLSCVDCTKYEKATGIKCPN
jgi:hypothetical protein